MVVIGNADSVCNNVNNLWLIFIVAYDKKVTNFNIDPECRHEVHFPEVNLYGNDEYGPKFR